MIWVSSESSLIAVHSFTVKQVFHYPSTKPAYAVAGIGIDVQINIAEFETRAEAKQYLNELAHYLKDQALPVISRQP